MNVNNRKGLILAGGSGTRLYPITHIASKQILPIYDKPMVYYPLSTLMLSKIREVAIISTPRDLPIYRDLLGDGSQWGMVFDYVEQPSPDGLAQAYLLSEKYLDGAPSALILGDNFFFGEGLSNKLTAAAKVEHCTVFGYQVNDPERYGVVEFDQNNKVLSIVEKPKAPKSNHAIVGIYFLDGQAPEMARKVTKSERGELEITDLLNLYRQMGKLSVEKLGRGYAWLDTGTHDSLLDAGNFIRTIEKRQNLKVGCPEEIAYLNKWISKEDLIKRAEPYAKTQYGKYLLSVSERY